MVITDTHSHLYSIEFSSDIDTVVEKAVHAGIKRMFLPNINIESIKELNNLCKKYPNIMIPMMGLHPCEVKSETYLDILNKIEEEYFTGKYSGVGEIGIDLYWDKSTKDIQFDVFVEQCRWAISQNQGVSIHCREAIGLTISKLKETKLNNLKGVFHCFTGSYEEAQEIINLGLGLGIGGVVTYKNTNLRETLKKIDIKHIVIETDCPYLPPVPFRGKRNEPIFILEVAKTLSEVYKMSIGEVAEITTKNSQEIFGC